MACNLQGL